MTAFSLAGCAQQPKTDNAQQAIDQSKSMTTVGEQIKTRIRRKPKVSSKKPLPS